MWQIWLLTSHMKEHFAHVEYVQQRWDQHNKSFNKSSVKFQKP